MSELGWIYEKQGVSPEQGINESGINTFTGSKLIEYLAREIGQNSLDAKDPEKKTVNLKFKLESLPKDTFPELSGMSIPINECLDYWKNRDDKKCTKFFTNAQNTFDNNDSIDVLIMSDYNTVGASGAKNDRRQKSKWKALTSSNGVTENGQGSRGAYGIGKNAPFACSIFRTIFYNTYSKDDNVKAFQGTSKLVTHTHNGEDVQGYGFCWDIENNKPIFDLSDSPLMKLLNRNEYGTDVLIIGFKKENNWKEQLEKGLLSNFFVAIANDELNICIEDEEINSKNIQTRMEYYANLENDLPDKEKIITKKLEFYNAFVAWDYKEDNSILDDDDVTLYIKKNDNYSKNIAYSRVGMIIYSRGKNLFTRYAALLTVKNGRLNNLLKDIEPPAHDNWDAGLLEDEKESKEAEKIRSKLIKWVSDQISEKCKSEYSEEIDLDGISEYLPFEDDDSSLGINDTNENSENNENSSGLDTNTKIVDDPIVYGQKVNQTRITAKKVKGIKDERIIKRNETNGGTLGGVGGVEDENSKDDVTAKGDGNKSLITPKVIFQRISGTPQDGRYSIVFKLENDCDRIRLYLDVLGDDANSESINIVSYKFENNEEKKNNTNYIELSDITSNKLYKAFITLEYKERLALEMRIE